MHDPLLYEIVKEMRADVKALDAKLHAHILLTTTQIKEAHAKAEKPITFLSQLRTTLTGAGAAVGLILGLKTIIESLTK